MSDYEKDVKELEYLRSKGTSEAKLNSLRLLPGKGTPPDILDDDGNVIKAGTVPDRTHNVFVYECEMELIQVTGGAESRFPWYE